jgi:hypothetical protein
MGGQGNFSDPRIGLAITQAPDLVTPKLPALLHYQLSLRTPEPPEGRFNHAAASAGARHFTRWTPCARGTCAEPKKCSSTTNGHEFTRIKTEDSCATGGRGTIRQTVAPNPPSLIAFGITDSCPLVSIRGFLRHGSGRVTLSNPNVRP